MPPTSSTSSWGSCPWAKRTEPEEIVNYPLTTARSGGKISPNRNKEGGAPNMTYGYGMMMEMMDMAMMLMPQSLRVSTSRF